MSYSPLILSLAPCWMGAEMKSDYRIPKVSLLDGRVDSPSQRLSFAEVGRVYKRECARGSE